MSTAIFLTPRGNGGGYDIQLGEDHLPEGYTRLVVFNKWGDPQPLPLGEGDWVQLRDCVDQMLHQR